MKKLLLTSITAATAAGAVADTKKDQAEQMLVTASRVEQSYAQTLAAATIIEREDIERLQASTLTELLARTPGVSFARNGGRGSTTSISLRGNQSDHTLFLINGVRIGSATLGSSPVELIDPALIERIEIVRGPKSGLYGSDALGGVINIITRKGDSERPLLLKAAYGTNNTIESSASLGTSGENYQVNLTISHVDTDGFDNTSGTTRTSGDDDAFTETAIGLTGSYSVSDSLTLGINYQKTTAESDYDAACSLRSTFAPVTCSPFADTATELINITADIDISPKWNMLLSAGMNEDNSDALASDVNLLTTFSGGSFNTEKTDFNWQNNFRPQDNTLLIIGFDYLNEKVFGTTQYDVDERDNKAIYLEYQITQGDFSLNLGGRSEDNEQFGNFETFNANLGYQLNSDIKVIASAGQGFKAPTFNDLYFPNFGNPNTVPEESDNYELTLKGSGDIDWTVSLFRNEVDKLIQYNFATFMNDQINSATIKGAEIQFSGEYQGWSHNTTITLLDTQNDRSGLQLARRPQQVVNVDIDRRFDQLSIGATFYAASSRFNDVGNTAKLDGYSTVALRAAYEINEQLKLQLKVDNVFDKDFVLAQASSFSGLGDYLQAGREVLFSVVYTPNF